VRVPALAGVKITPNARVGTLPSGAFLIMTPRAPARAARSRRSSATSCARRSPSSRKTVSFVQPARLDPAFVLQCRRPPSRSFVTLHHAARKPKLVVVLVGERKDSQTYVRMKTKVRPSECARAGRDVSVGSPRCRRVRPQACQEAGMESVLVRPCALAREWPNELTRECPQHNLSETVPQVLRCGWRAGAALMCAQAELEDLIRKLNADPTVDGILVQARQRAWKLQQCQLIA
jgi:hypothetical protein